MGWSSGGAMASAFLNYAHQTGFTTTTNKTRYTIQGLVLLASGGQFCYAYDTVAELAGSGMWKACGAGGSSAGSFVGGCCPSNLTEDYCAWTMPCEHSIYSIYLFYLSKILSISTPPHNIVEDWQIC
jgi:hypothetical protein